MHAVYKISTILAVYIYLSLNYISDDTSDEFGQAPFPPDAMFRHEEIVDMLPIRTMSIPTR